MATARNYYTGFSGKQEADGDTGKNSKAVITRFVSGIPACERKNSMVKRAADSWQLLTREEQDEYTDKAVVMSIEGVHLFMYEYLTMSGMDIRFEIRKKEKVLQ